MRLREQVTQPLDSSYRIIPLTRGQVAFCDPEDFEVLSKFNWNAAWNKNAQTFYAVRTDKDRHTILMHRQIITPPDGIDVDHRDRNGLNNRRGNLRSATRSQNQCNRGLQSNNKSGFKGVCFHKAATKWEAYLNVGGKRHYLGLFATVEEARCAYAEAASHHHGQFAALR